MIVQRVQLIAIIATLTAGCKESQPSDSPEKAQNVLADSRPVDLAKLASRKSDGPNANNVAVEPGVGEDVVIPTGAVGVAFAPRDISTTLAGGPLEVHLRMKTTAGQLLTQLASSVSIRTWPELAPVSSTVQAFEYSDEVGTAKAFIPFPFVRLTPTAELDDRWYVISMRPVPGTVMADRQYVQISDGTVGARFRTGSQLVPRDFRHVAKGNSHYVVVEFTERFRLMDSARVLTILDRPGSQCILDSGGFGSSDGSAMSLLFSCGSEDFKKVTVLSFDFTGIVGTTGNVVTEIPGPLVSAASVPVVSSAGGGVFQRP